MSVASEHQQYIQQVVYIVIDSIEYTWFCCVASYYSVSRGTNSPHRKHGRSALLKASPVKRPEIKLEKSGHCV